MLKTITATNYLGKVVNKEMKEYRDLYVIGQGVTDPFYTGDFYSQISKDNKTRVIDAPISENLIGSIGIGGAITGAKILVIFPRMDFCLYAMNSIVNEAGQYKFLHNGEGINITYIMLIENEGGLLGSKHLQNFQSIFMHFPTLSIYYPSDRNTFYLTINSCLSNNDIDILIINKKIDIGSTFSNYQTNGTLRKLKKGKDLTIITYGKHIQDVLNILDILKEKGIEPDIFDIFSFKGYNLDILIQSINYTKKLLIIDGTRQTCNLSTDIIKNLYLNYTIQNIKIDILNIPETYVPANYYLEKAYFITKEDIFNRIINLCYDN